MATNQQLRARLESERDAMVDLLGRLVEIETPSRDAKAQQAALELLAKEFDESGLRVRRVAGEATGGHLLAEPIDLDGRERRQLLLGHCDTVWPLGTLADQPLRLAGGRLFGPGAYDMKAGLVQIVFALRTLAAEGLRPDLAPVVFVNSDEEIGSPESTPWIRRLARHAERVFVLEPSLGPEGRLKTRRKGIGRFTVTVTGRAAHAGLAPESGASAILALSHLVQSIDQLNDATRGTTVNVGTVRGGVEPNVVAPEAAAEIDVRVLDLDEAKRIEDALAALEPPLPGTRIEVSGGFGRPPMVQTPGGRRLWEQARELGAELGLELEEGTAGGASDGNTTGELAPTLDGLGAVGDGAHARHEQVDVERLPERAALLAALLLAPTLDEGTSHVA